MIFIDEDEIVEWLIRNHERVKFIIEPSKKEFKKMLNSRNNRYLKQEIIDEYNSLVKNKIGDVATKDLAISLESVIIVLEGINLDEYLK